MSKSTRSPPLLTEFIQQHHKQIIGEWVEFARQLHPWSAGLSDKTLTDHAEELLKAVVADMQSPQTSLQKSEKSKGHALAGGALTSVGHRHASDRLETGFKLDQLVSEYRALRASVVRLWSEEHGDEQNQMTRFNEAIDETLAEAAVRYSDLLNHTREQFLAALGHDLRNPLSAITLGAALLSKSESIDDKQARVAARIVTSAKRMTRMVGYLLDLARTRLGSSIPLSRTKTDLTSVCQQVIAELEVIYPNSQLHFESRGDLKGEWDSDRLSQVMSNLVSNAVQYGKPPVSVVAREHGDEVVLQVHNDGPVISLSALKTVFEPLVRHPTSNGNKNATGLGLGLYIAREVVLAHGGTIEVRSTDKEGTTFTVQIPRWASGKKARLGRSNEVDDEQRSSESYRLDRRLNDRRHASAENPR